VDDHLRALRSRHTGLADAVVIDPSLRAGVGREFDHLFHELDTLAHATLMLHERSACSADAIAAFGELLSSRLVTAALNSAGIGATWIDARRALMTDRQHGRAVPLVEPTTERLRRLVGPVLETTQVAVLGGYIGATEDGVTTTLGRGGSDYSAALFGACLKASEIQIWTDVDGLLTADPRVIGDAQLVPQLSYAKASELAYFSAKVLHPATIQPAVGKAIPVRILNSRRPDGPGTLITAHPPASSSPVTALACKRHVTVIEITSARMLMAHGFLNRLFGVFDRFQTPVDVVTTSEVNVSVTIDDTRHLPELVDELSTFAGVSCERHMAILCVVGDNLRSDPTIFTQIVAALDGVAFRMVSQSASRRNVTFVLGERDLPDAMARLHTLLFVEGRHARRPISRA
jgi:aspartate kinase